MRGLLSGLILPRGNILIDEDSSLELGIVVRMSDSFSDCSEVCSLGMIWAAPSAVFDVSEGSLIVGGFWRKHA